MMEGLSDDKGKLRRYVARVDDSGPFTLWVCRFCKAGLFPLLFENHLRETHPEEAESDGTL